MRYAIHETSFPTEDKLRIGDEETRANPSETQPSSAPTHLPHPEAPGACPLPPFEGEAILGIAEPEGLVEKRRGGKKSKRCKGRIAPGVLTGQGREQRSPPVGRSGKGRGKAKAKARPILNTPVRRPSRRSQRVTMKEAMREQGLDEQKVAATIAGTLDVLCNSVGDQGITKLLVDVLKDCARLLEPPKGEHGGLGEGPVTVELVHDVPRPERTKP